MAGPLDGVRILELTAVVLGPWACQLLADMGADVIKVEAPRGDSNRSVGATRTTKNMGALYLTCNRNKRSVIIDLKKKSGVNALLELARTSDVLIHNNRPSAMTRLGLDYAALKKVNPRIIYCGAYGYGRKGPYGDKPALDDSIQAASGVAALNAMVMGEPRFMPTIVCDKTTAITAVYGVLAALFHRERSGEGQELEVPMFETMVSYLMAEHMWGKAFEPPLGPAGYARLMSPDRRPYRTKDGYVAVLPYLDAHWIAFCRLADRADLLEDPRFSSLSQRSAHINDTYAETAKILAGRTSQDWLDLFTAHNIPASRVNSLDDLIDDPHLKAVDFWKLQEHPTEGTLRSPAFPVNFSETPSEMRHPPPRHGEHSVEVLRQAGLDQAAIDALIAEGTVIQAKAP